MPSAIVGRRQVATAFAVGGVSLAGARRAGRSLNRISSGAAMKIDE